MAFISDTPLDDFFYVSLVHNKYVQQYCRGAKYFASRKFSTEDGPTDVQ